MPTNFVIDLRPNPVRLRVEAKEPTLKQALFGITLAATSGLAIVAHTFGPLPMNLTVPFVVMPGVAILGCAILLGRRLNARFHVVAGLLMLGAWTGGLATVAYDLSRMLLRLLFQFRFSPFAAIPIFGQLMTGLSSSHRLALAAGWVYHFWNGISFGMMFAVFRPRGGVIAGLVWGLGLAALMLVTYPQLLHVAPNEPGFLISDFVGHGVWGLTLGLSFRKWGLHA